jgi:hypothetical protein
LIDSGKLIQTNNGSPQLLCVDDELGNRLLGISVGRFGFTKGETKLVTRTDTIDLPLSIKELRPYGAGFDPAECQVVVRSGLSLIARVSNPPSASAGQLLSVFAEVVMTGAEGIMFQGDQVLGWRQQLEESADLIRRSNLWYGSIEFGNQAGDARLTSLLLENSPTPQVLRVHSMLAAEMNQNAEPSIVDRYVRAAAERNIKVLYLRPRGSAEVKPLGGFTAFVSEIAAGIQSEGFAAKRPSLESNPEIQPALRWLTALGIAVFVCWLVQAAFGIRWFTVACVAVFACVFALQLRGSETAPKLFALAIAIAAPTWAVASAFSGSGVRCAGWWGYVWISAASVLAGFHVAALLTSMPYMLHSDQFLGVKLAHFLPPVLVGGYLLLERMRLSAALDAQVRWLDAALMVMVGIALLLVLVRTGNDAPTAVSGFELRMRELMDKVLIERPRTKEVFFGNPALVLALMLACARKTRWVPLLALIAAIGQASIVNTFCHLHTPLLTSLIRVLVGLVLGGIFGFAVWVVVKPFWGRTPSPE